MTEMDRAAVVDMLSQSMGQQKATEVVNTAADHLGLPAVLSHTQVLALLEAVASQPGIVGVAARFAKSRLLLRRA